MAPASGGQSIFSTWDQERTYQELLVIQVQLLHNRGECEIEVDKSFVWGDGDTESLTRWLDFYYEL